MGFFFCRETTNALSVIWTSKAEQLRGDAAAAAAAGTGRAALSPLLEQQE